MKKIIALIMTLTMIFVLAACGGEETTESIEEVIIVSSEESVTENTSSTASKVDTNPSSQTAQPTACTHKNINTVAAVAASCDREGKTESKVCKDCGKVIVAAQIIPKDDHIFNPATETTPETCALCGTTRGDVATPDTKVGYRNSFPLTLSNGASLEYVSIDSIETVGSGKCNIKYSVTINNGAKAGIASWTIDVFGGDVGPKATGIKGETSRALAANEQSYVESFETGPITAADQWGYTLLFK